MEDKNHTYDVIVLGTGLGGLQGSSAAAELVVLTGIPMVLFTFYMITDPQTSRHGPEVRSSSGPVLRSPTPCCSSCTCSTRCSTA